MNVLPVDPWLSKPQTAVVDPWLSKSQPLGDPWQLNSNTSITEQKSIPADPWAIGVSKIDDMAILNLNVQGVRLVYFIPFFIRSRDHLRSVRRRLPIRIWMNLTL